MIDFQLGFRVWISNADKMSDIPLSVLENMSKKDMESFIPYLRERPSWTPIQPNNFRRPHIGLFVGTF